MANKYHINPEKGPLRCTADDGQCPYGVDAPHFSNKQEAQQIFENKLEAELKPLASLKKNIKSSKLDTNNIKRLDEKIQAMSFEEIHNFALSNEKNLKELNSLVDKRIETYCERLKTLNILSPDNKNSQYTLSQSSYNIIKKRWDDYRDETAILIDMCNESEIKA